MRYLSTRGGLIGGQTSAPFSTVLLEGLASDGGLSMPESYPKAELDAWRSLSYPALCLEIVSRFVDDIPRDALKTIIDKTYTPDIFGSAEITPVRELEPGLSLLCVSNGPTLAFKDIALQLLGNLFEYVLAREGRIINILGATSGDTGSSAEYAMRGKRGIKVFMLSPHKRMSAFQQAQMYTLDDPNIFNLAIEGTFDCCQDIVKAVGGDAAFKKQYHLGAVNSINWARVMAQIVYYFKGYFAVTRKNGEPLDVAVPSGNFGNILAAHIAKQMGLPLRRLILATNENDVLDEFFKRGHYRPRSPEETHATSSPSMDISKASNFERFIFDCVGRDGAAMRELWAQLTGQGGFDLTAPKYQTSWQRVQASGFVSSRSTHADRLQTIRDVYHRYGVMIDPHTADGVKVGQEYRETGVPLLCVETALPAKFAATIEEALGKTPPRPDIYAGIEQRPQHYKVLPADADAVKAFMRERLI
ncbi:MAG: threonine synthase [Proteobacteria bacterium]|nr:threonine synthase [Pseudomonadota bacterium]MCL2306992.1 threonine synthase [Pseudomonadota bacterium]